MTFVRFNYILYQTYNNFKNEIQDPHYYELDIDFPAGEQHFSLIVNSMKIRILSSRE